MASPRLGPCSERAWSPPQTNGGTGTSPPAQAAWPGPAACRHPGQEVSVVGGGGGGGDEVGLVYLGLSDDFEMPPLYLTRSLRTGRRPRQPWRTAQGSAMGSLQPGPTCSESGSTLLSSASPGLQAPRGTAAASHSASYCPLQPSRRLGHELAMSSCPQAGPGQGRTPKHGLWGLRQWPGSVGQGFPPWA